MRPLFPSWQKRNSESNGRAKASSKLKLESLEDRVNPSIGFGFAIGGDTSGSSVSEATATDNAGDVFVTGNFQGTVHFGTATLVAQGSQDAFVAKYGAAGGLNWVVDLGGTNDTVVGAAIAVDSSGNVYTTGSFTGNNVNFDPNAPGHMLSSSNAGSNTNAYVLKMNANGIYQWAVDLGYGGSANGAGVAVDNSTGDVDTTGSFSGSGLNFSPIVGNTHQLSSSHGGGDTNAYVSSLNSSGQYIFAVDLGSGGTAHGAAIAVNSAFGIVTTGSFSGLNLNFDPTASDNQLSSSHAGGDTNAYVSKLNALGGDDFGVALGTGGTANASAIAMDGSGNVFTTGDFDGTAVNFDPNSSNHQLFSSASGSNFNAYVSELNSLGQYIYADDLGYGGSAGGTGIALDGSDDPYIVGSFTGTAVSLNPNLTGNLYTSSNFGGSTNAFLVRLNSSGQYILSEDLGYGGTTIGNGIAVDSSNDIYTSGSLLGTNVNFNPFGAYYLSSPSGQNSFFVSKLTQSFDLVAETLPNGGVGDKYDLTLAGQVTGATGLVTFAIGTGTFPPGLNLVAGTGEITGIPTTQGKFTFTVTVTDSIGEQTGQSFTITINGYTSNYSQSAYDYTNAAYIYAYDAFISGQGSYYAFFYEYYANLAAMTANTAALAGNAAGTEANAYYAYYYGYLGYTYAYEDYAQSGSIYSYAAFEYGYYGQYYSYYTSIGY